MRPRQFLSDKDYFAIMRKARGRCWYCGVKIWPCDGRLGFATVDHFRPWQAGGTDDPANLVPACKPCNSAKGHRPLDHLRHVVAIQKLGMPDFTRKQIAWMRQAGADLSDYDGFKFWFEAHRNRHTGATVRAGFVNENKASRE